LEHLEETNWLEPCRHLIDARLVPPLLRVARAGTDQLLASLCRIASWIPSSAVDPLLCALFHRWHTRFEPQLAKVQHDQNRYLWMAFGTLTQHPRFKSIPDYDLRLLELLPIKMWSHNKKGIVRALLDAPRAYFALESRLFGMTQFEHWRYDEVDQLD